LLYLVLVSGEPLKITDLGFANLLPSCHVLVLLASLFSSCRFAIWKLQFSAYVSSNLVIKSDELVAGGVETSPSELSFPMESSLGFASEALELSKLPTSSAGLEADVGDATRGEKFSTYLTSELWGNSLRPEGEEETCCTIFSSGLVQGSSDEVAGLTLKKESLVLKEGLGIELGLGLDNKDA